MRETASEVRNGQLTPQVPVILLGSAIFFGHTSYKNFNITQFLTQRPQVFCFFFRQRCGGAFMKDIDERVCIPRGKRQSQCRPVQRGRPAERSPRAQNPDAKSRDTRDNAVQLRHVEPARVSLRHAAPSLPQALDSLHRWAKVQSRRPPNNPMWTRLSRREVRASRRLYAGGGFCLRDLWRAWRIRDCGSA